MEDLRRSARVKERSQRETEIDEMSTSSKSSRSSQRSRVELAKLQFEYEKRQAEISLKKLQLQEDILNKEISFRKEELKLSLEEELSDNSNPSCFEFVQNNVDNLPVLDMCAEIRMIFDNLKTFSVVIYVHHLRASRGDNLRLLLFKKRDKLTRIRTFHITFKS